MEKIIPCLWFDDQAADAAAYYVSIFKNSGIDNTSYYGEAGPMPVGTVLTVMFHLDGRPYMALNGGAVYKLSPAFSLVVNCENQVEVDELWEKLSEGGEKGQCGWLNDRFGVSWQIVPTILGVLMGDQDPVKAMRVTQALLRMTKLDIDKLKLAYAGK